MSLFNKKEEVLNTELTQYGKKMLSIGNFNPVYYAFYDDEVLYDTDCASFSESHTQSKSRIKDSITFKPFYSFTSIQSNDKMSLDNELGNSSLFSEYAPAWDIRVLNNEFKTCSITPPSASMTITYEAETKQNFQKDTEILYRTSTYEDGYFLQIKRNYILLDIQEYNSYEEPGKNKLEVQFSILEDGKETFLTFEDAQKYLDILTDSEINSQIICEKISDAGDIYSQLMKKCNNYNGDLIFGKDDSDQNIYNFDGNRGEIC